MNREDIIRMAREAGLDPDLWNYTDAFERFASLAAAAEREACAKICADLAAHREVGAYGMLVAHSCANEILARGQA